MENGKITVVITAKGRGERMKGFGPQPKHLLYYRDKRIIDHIKECFTTCEVLDGEPDNNRTETLELLRGRKNVLIVDCDIIPLEHGLYYLDSIDGKLQKGDKDVIWCFDSDNPKYGGLYPDKNYFLQKVVEKGDTQTKCRASGLYFLKDVGATIDRMTDLNSIASGMIGAKMVFENTFIRVGDPEDYLAALK
jgi:hypothetical protein